MARSSHFSLYLGSLHVLPAELEISADPVSPPTIVTIPDLDGLVVSADDVTALSPLVRDHSRVVVERPARRFEQPPTPILRWGGDLVAGTPWTLDLSQQCVLTVDCTASAIVRPALHLPHPGILRPQPIRIQSETYPDPTVENGRPETYWRPESVHRSELGFMRLNINGQDMTFFRNVPTRIDNWVTNDPFGDARASVTFPQITEFEDPYEVIPKYSDFRIELWVRISEYDWVFNKEIFCGMIEEHSDTGEGGTTYNIRGAFYESDLLRRKPTFQDEIEDTAVHIQTTLNGFIFFGLNLQGMPYRETGFKTRARGFFEKVGSEYIQNLLTRLKDPSTGEVWTIECANRRPILKPKDFETVHWTVYAGGRGIRTGLTSNDLEDPNMIYGEGVAENNCLWRNTKYPNIVEAPPIWEGNLISATGYNYGADVLLFKEKMSNSGWPHNKTPEYTLWDQYHTGRFQQMAGLTVDGFVGAQTWAAAFDNGLDAGDLSSVYIQPLAWHHEVMPYAFGPDGGIRGSNASFDPDIPRIEEYINFGNGTDIMMGVDSAKRLIDDNYNVPGYRGSLTLSMDPEEDSRFLIRAGQNIKLKNYRGRDVLLHIAQSQVDFSAGSVTLEVDERFRDMLTLAQLKQRNDEAKLDPASRTYKRRDSSNVNDMWPIWDCESRSGIIPKIKMSPDNWICIRIPAGKYGEIVTTDFTMDEWSEFSIGIFSRPIYANTLKARGRPQEMEDFWLPFEEQGLLIAWGSKGNMAGYSPGNSRDNDPNGKLIDRSPWVYSSDHPPWLWVCMYTPDSYGIIEGRLYPGAQSGETIPVLFGAPIGNNPQ